MMNGSLITNLLKALFLSERYPTLLGSCMRSNIQRGGVSMTTNQIAYLKYQEDKRHNLASEAEQNRSNVANETLGQDNLTETRRANKVREYETSRSNRANEDLTRMRNDETHRANVANEELTRMRNEETHRTNLANETLTSLRDTEAARANQAREAETHRSNVVNERLTEQRDAEVARSNAAKEYETHRSSVEREKETHRSNTANEAELHRSNVAKEAENYRHNTTTEYETSLHNIALETYQRDQVQQNYYAVDTQAQTADKDRASREDIASVDASIKQQQADAASKQATAAEVKAWNEVGKSVLGAVVKAAELSFSMNAAGTAAALLK